MPSNHHKRPQNEKARIEMRFLNLRFVSALLISIINIAAVVSPATAFEGDDIPAHLRAQSGIVNLVVFERDAVVATDIELFNEAQKASYSTTPALSNCFNSKDWSYCTTPPSNVTPRHPACRYNCLEGTVVSEPEHASCPGPACKCLGCEDKCAEDLAVAARNNWSCIDSIFKSGALKHDVFRGNCTGAIIYANKNGADKETIILTAAHCFYKQFHQRLFRDIYPTDRFQRPSVRITYNDTGKKVSDIGTYHGVSKDLTKVYVYPAWIQNPDWFDVPDIALIKVKDYVPVLDTSGNEIPVFKRPVYIGKGKYIKNQFEDALPQQLYKRVVACGYGKTDDDSDHRNILRCGLGSDIYARADGYFAIEGDHWVDGAGFRAGDSGGPYIVVKNKGNQQSKYDWVNEGVLIGAISGPALGDSLALTLPCPCDYFATATFGLADWIESVVGPGKIHFVNESYFGGVASTCDPGHYLSGGVCKPQVCPPGKSRDCTNKIANAAEANRWCAGDGSGFGSCKVTDCQSGFVVSGNKCKRQSSSGNQGSHGHTHPK